MIDYSTLLPIENIDKIGSFYVTKHGWDLDHSYDENIPIHQCTEEDKASFYEPTEVTRPYYGKLFTQMYCITNPDQIIFWGDFNGDTASGYKVGFKECDDSVSCFNKTEKEDFF